MLGILLISTVSALSATETETNSTFSTISLTGNDLYAYEINLDYTGSTPSVADHTNIFSSCGVSTSGSSARDDILSVYGSCLNATFTGLNYSGDLFDVSHSGTVSLRYILAVYANSSEEYVYYNETGSDSETESTTQSSSSGGGGGGGGVAEFDVTPSLVQASINHGETTRRTVTITNRKTTLLTLTLNAGTLSKFVVFDESTLKLLPGESREVNIDIFIPSETPADVYTGQISVKSESSERKINVMIEVDDKAPLFDVVIDLDETSYAPTDTVSARIETENFGELRNIDVLLYYAIRDFEGNDIVSKEESYAIDNYKVQLVGKLKLPADIDSGDYLFYTRVSYGDITATASQVFTVVEPGLSRANTFISILAFAIVIVLVVATVIIYYTMRKKSYSVQQPTYQMGQQ